MIQAFAKLIITTLLIVAISEISKRNTLAAALLASIPLVSVLAILWLYIETHDVSKVAALANGVFWLVIPSLAFFISLPALLKLGLNFYLSMGLSIAISAACYWLMVYILPLFGIKL
jgi:hypothetical protein